MPKNELQQICVKHYSVPNKQKKSEALKIAYRERSHHKSDSSLTWWVAIL